MAALTTQQVKDLIRRTQRCFEVIDHEDWDAARSMYRSSNIDKWQQAAHEAVPPIVKEWREIIRVLAQGESYYGGAY
jgi:hypothetical protein